MTPRPYDWNGREPDYDDNQLPEACARCGHTPGGCANCDRVDLFLGGYIGRPGHEGEYCHTFSPTQPTCYTLESWEK